MSDSTRRSACHPPLLPSLPLSRRVSLSLSQKKLLCLFLSPAPTPSPLLILLVFPELCSYGEKWRCAFLKERCGVIGRSFLFLLVFLIFTLLYLCFCVPLNEGRCQGSGCSETQRSYLRCKIVRKIEDIKTAMKCWSRNLNGEIKLDITPISEKNLIIIILTHYVQLHGWLYTNQSHQHEITITNYWNSITLNHFKPLCFPVIIKQMYFSTK